MLINISNLTIHISLQDECPICKERDANQLTMHLECNHRYHEYCILKWLESSGKCPVCRHVVISGNPEAE